MPIISDHTITAMVAHLCGVSDTLAVSLAGSYARGDATVYSDVDLTRYVATLPDNPDDRYTLHVYADRLVTIYTTTFAARRAELTQPEAAIWAIPGLMQARILLDSTG